MDTSMSPERGGARMLNESSLSILDKSSPSLPKIAGRNRDSPLSKSFDNYSKGNGNSRFGSNAFQLKNNLNASRNDIFRVSVQDMVNSQTRNNNNDFGISGYYVPDNNAYLQKPRTFMISKTNGQDFISKVQKDKGYLPACNHYETQVNMLWKKNWSIYKKKRTSFTDDIFKKAKETPGVGAYDIKRKEKIKGSYKSTLDRYSVMEEAAYVSKFVPFHYQTPKMELTHTKSPIVKLRGETQKEAEQEKRKWQKKNEPSPFSYKVEESISKTQLPRGTSWKITNTKNLKFTDVVIKEKKNIPGVGHYETEKSFDKIARPKGWK